MMWEPLALPAAGRRAPSATPRPVGSSSSLSVASAAPLGQQEAYGAPVRREHGAGAAAFSAGAFLAALAVGNRTFAAKHQLRRCRKQRRLRRERRARGGYKDTGNGALELSRREEPPQYLAMKMQSPHDIRSAAAVSIPEDERGDGAEAVVYGEITTTDKFDADGKPSAGGLFCLRAFGGQGAFSRRRKMGVIELAWPCSHVWFTGAAKMARAARFLGQKVQDVIQVRQYQQDMYLGEWTAVGVHKLHRKLGQDRPQVPAVGSPVAAAEEQKLHRMVAHEFTDDEHSKDEFGLQFPGSRQERCLASLAQAACSKLIWPEASRLARATQHALAAEAAAEAEASEAGESSAAGEIAQLGIDLSSLVLDMYLLARQQKEGDAAARLTREAIPYLVKEMQPQLKEMEPQLQRCGLELEEVVEVLAKIIRNEKCRAPLSKAAGTGSTPESLYELWERLTLSPGFEGGRQPLGKLLEEIQADVEQLLEGKELSFHDAAYMVRLVKSLLVRAQAMAETSLQVYQSGTATATASQHAKKRSRFSPEPYEVCWYDSGMAPAAFHMEDVERLRDRVQFGMELPDVEEEEEEEVEEKQVEEIARKREETSGTQGRKEQRRGLTRPSGAISSGQAAYYRAGQPAEARWHLPLQDSTRPGCGGGAHPMRVGEVIGRQTSGEVTAFAAARPRPAGTPRPVPTNRQAEGALFTSSGGMAVRHLLQGVEPLSRRQEISGIASALTDVVELSDFFERETGQGFVKSYIPEVLKGHLLRRTQADTLISKGHAPEWMVFMELPVLPPDLRLQGKDVGDALNSDLGVMYNRIIEDCRNVEDDFIKRRPAGMFRYHILNLQGNVDALIDNGRMGREVTKTNGAPYESLAMRLKGKSGRMRLNLLGKRVDYSARSVIVVDPQLNLDECGLPFAIARQLYSWFVVGEMRKTLGITRGNASLNRDLLESFDKMPKDKQWEILERCLAHRYVALNRAPTLHRLSIQAFKPKLIEGQAIKIHPLVCSPFNADFDGDTMTVHLALSSEAQEEYKSLMMPSKNLSSPASGDPVIGPTQDMVLGIYYLTHSHSESMDGQDPQARVCHSVEDFEAVAEQCSAGEIPKSTPVKVPLTVLSEVAPDAVEDDATISELRRTGAETLETTAGRVLFFLLVHKAYMPPKRPEVQLLEQLDCAPLVG